MLKILAGEAKGRPIKTLSNAPHLRPILARVKKSLFDILKPRIQGTRFLDIYAGTGAVGLEALSRGAASAVFVENDRRSLQVLDQNIRMLKYDDKCQIFSLEAPRGLALVPGRFDLIFMGPPYKDDEKNPLQMVTPTLEALFAARQLADHGWIMAQHHKKEIVTVPNVVWELFRQERYGDTMVSFIRWVQA